MKQLLLIMFTLCCLETSSHTEDDGITIEGIRYHIESGEAIVTSKDEKYVGNIDIPATITYGGNTYSVMRIGAGAFEWCKELLSVVIPESVKTIEENAFQGCDGLRAIKIPNSVSGIGRNAFRGCNQLYVVVIPESVQSVGERAFYSCTNLNKVVVHNAAISIGSEAFAFCKSLISVEGLHAQMNIFDEKEYHSAFYGTPFSKQNFEYYALRYICPKIKEWQQKGEFETTEQYQNRVTKENQQKKIDELLTEVSNQYIKEYTSQNKLNVALGTYNADNELYTLDSNYGIKYVKVPLSEAPRFKQDFRRATFEVSYAIGDDKPLVADMTVCLNGKTYQAEKDGTRLVENNYQIDLPAISLSLTQNQQPVTPTKPVAIDRSIDQNIPTVSVSNDNTFAVIIGNEQYIHVVHVAYAKNDAHVFAEYCKKTLGLPEKNVRVYENATYGTLISAVSDIRKIAKAFKGDINVIFYYAGHGIPDNASRDAYLLPIDADGRQMEICYSLSNLYKALGEMNVKSVTIFLDACFSGAVRGDGMLTTARGVAIKTSPSTLQGSMVVFSAAADEQTAFPYSEKGHGMFTYFLLKKLRDTMGNVTLGDLGNYIRDEVTKQAIVVKGREQTPTVNASAILGDSWRSMKLR